MSLALAYYEKERFIYLASESQGAPYKCLDSKIICFQRDPLITAVGTGYLKRWCNVREKYRNRKQKTVRSAAERILELLGVHLEGVGDAFGLVCGFQDGKAQCFRVANNRNVLDDESDFFTQSLVRHLGEPRVAGPAREKAQNEINKNTCPIKALYSAIKNQIITERNVPDPNKRILREPINLIVMDEVSVREITYSINAGETEEL